MKKLCTLLLCIISLSVRAQWGYVNYIDFDGSDSLYSSIVRIDGHYAHNIWQIGAPHKTVFTSAFTTPNVIVTDTLNPYPANDTSVFTIKVPTRVFGMHPLEAIQMRYQLNIDSNATAIMEISDDDGLRWVNIKDSLPYRYHSAGIPDLTVSTAGWTTFTLSRCAYCPDIADSVIFRFTFMSNSTPGVHDGWMLDNFFFYYFSEDVKSLFANEGAISVYPNPSDGDITVRSAKADAQVSVYNMSGQEVYKTSKLPDNGKLNLQLPNGIYMLNYTSADEHCVKQIVINR